MPRRKQGRRQGNECMAAFLQAVQWGDFAKVHELLANGCSVNQQIVHLDGDCLRRLTPLCAAVDCGNIDMVKGLIQAGAVVNTKCVNTWKPFRMQSMSALFMACRSGQLDIIQALVDAGAHVNGPDYNLVEHEEEGGSISFSDSANTCLHQAVIAKQYDVMLKLLSCGASPCVLNGGRETPLHLACELHHLNCIKILVKAGGLSIQDSPLVASPLYFVLDSWRNKDKEKYLAKLMIAAGYDLQKDLMMEALFYQSSSRKTARKEHCATCQHRLGACNHGQPPEMPGIGEIDLNQTENNPERETLGNLCPVNGPLPSQFREQGVLQRVDEGRNVGCGRSENGHESQNVSRSSKCMCIAEEQDRENVWRTCMEPVELDWIASDEEEDEDIWLGLTGMEDNETNDFEAWIPKRFGPQFCRFLTEAPFFPPRLMFMCRLVIRRACGPIKLTQKIQVLPAPKSVKQYLNLDIL